MANSAKPLSISSSVLLLAALFALAGCNAFAPAIGEILPPRPAPGVSRAAPADTCSPGPLRTLLVTAFPLRHPEQIPLGGYVAWPQATATELARLLEAGARVRAVPAPDRFPFASAETAPALERRDNAPVIAAWAREAGAQFVLAGVFRDFAVVPHTPLGVPERHLVVDAYLFDAFDARETVPVARREFAWKLPASGQLPRASDPGPGTREFAATRFGQLYGALVGEIARWAEEELACRTDRIPRPKPLPSR